MRGSSGSLPPAAFYSDPPSSSRIMLGGPSRQTLRRRAQREGSRDVRQQAAADRPVICWAAANVAATLRAVSNNQDSSQGPDSSCDINMSSADTGGTGVMTSIVHAASSRHYVQCHNYHRSNTPASQCDPTSVRAARRSHPEHHTEDIDAARTSGGCCSHIIRRTTAVRQRQINETRHGYGGDSLSRSCSRSLQASPLQ